MLKFSMLRERRKGGGRAAEERKGRIAISQWYLLWRKGGGRARKKYIAATSLTIPGKNSQWYVLWRKGGGRAAEGRHMLRCHVKI